MSKKFLILLLIPVLLLTVTACGKQQSDTENDKVLTKTIELHDDKLGFTTTFTYNSEEKYTEPVEDNSGKSTSIYFENEDLDATFEMYYTTMRTTTYNDTEKTRSKQKYYKEYTFGDYEAYAYSEYPDKINLNVLLGVDGDDAEVLFVTIERKDNSEEVIIPDIFDERMQDFFKSMEFVKE